VPVSVSGSSDGVERQKGSDAEGTEEEFIYVIEGEPDVWFDGQRYRLKPGNGVGFRAGTGIAHSFLNSTGRDVRLLAVGEHARADNWYAYPLHPERDAALGDRLWADAPERELGPHDGLPDLHRRGGQRLRAEDDVTLWVIALHPTGNTPYDRSRSL
jgi:uncharacterized cupin superfamily protein